MWNDRYSKPEFAFGKVPNDFLQATFAHIPKGGHVLCLGEGEGRNAVFFAEQGYEVTAVDLADVGLKKAHQLAKERGVEIRTIIADLIDYDLGVDKWDGIVSIWVHMPEQARQKLHHNIATALTKNGVFILEAYTKAQLHTDAVGGPPVSQQERFMALDKLRDELTPLYEVIGIETMREISEGKRHVGLSAVVQFLARK